MNYTVGTTPYSVTTGDFNADGNRDIAIANNGTNNVSVLLGTGTGIFGAKTDFTVGTGPRSVTTGDFNADGKTDLAAANYGGNTVSILLGTGTGSFGAKTDFAAGALPTSVTTGDFNADGKIDLAVTNVVGPKVAILLGVGNGTFNAPVTYTVGAIPNSVTTGDFNADGKIDLAVTNQTPGTISVLLGVGNGTFGAKTDFTVGTNPYSVTTGDFNADGKIDLAAANNIGSTAGISVLIGAGNGTFGAKTDYPGGSSPQSITTADFNNDGYSDLAVANSVGAGILPGVGNGTFGARIDFGFAGSASRSVANGDFNGDGKPDLAVTNQSNANVSILLNTTPSSVKAITAFTVPSQVGLTVINEAAHTITLKMPYGTNVTALTPTIVSTGSSVSPANGVANNFTNPATYTVTAADSSTQIYTVTIIYTPAITAFTISGQVGLTTINEAAHTIMLNMPNGTDVTALVPTVTIYGASVSPVSGAANNFTSPATYTVTAADATTQDYVVTVVVLSADQTAANPVIAQIAALPAVGNLVLADKPAVTAARASYEALTAPQKTLVTNYATLTAAETRISVLESSKAITAFTVPNQVGLTTIDEVAHTITVKMPYGTDVTALIPTVTISGASVNPSSGATRNFTSPVTYTVTAADSTSQAYSVTIVFTPAITAFTVPNQVGLTTINEVAHTITLKMPYGTNVTALVPTVTIAGASVSPASGAARNFTNPVTYTVTAADATTQSYVVTVAFVGDPSFSAAVNYAVGATPYSIASSDFNADGRKDLAVANYGSSTVSILLGTGTGAFGAKTDYAAGSGPSSVATGDFNADGKTDLAVANYTGNSVSILLGTGTGAFGAKTDYAAGSILTSVATGDFNADGKLDLAVTNVVGPFVSILLGVGNGTFLAKTSYPVGAIPNSVATGDFNADGKLDLAVANQTPSTVSILLGAGNGTFGAKSDFAVGLGPYSVTIGDFNSDGKKDLAVANSINSTAGVSVLLGVGNGTFLAKTDYAAGDSPQSITAGDYNADGFVDLAVSNWDGVSILLGVGDGLFGVRKNFLFPTNGIRSIVTDDFNGDLKADLAIANQASNNVSILLNSTPSSVRAITAFSVPGQVGQTIINEVTHTVAFVMPYGTNVTALAPTIVTTGSTVSPASGVANDFSAPTAYVVTAANSIIQSYMVTVSFSAQTIPGGGGSGGSPGAPAHGYSTQGSSIDPLLVAAMQSLGFAIHDLVKLPNDGNPATQTDSTVYYLGVDGRRHAFVNSSVYFSWYCGFTGIRTISGNDLAKIPLGRNVGYRPGLRLVKFPSVPKVYLVQTGGVLRPIPDEATAAQLIGSDWNIHIADISEAFFTDYVVDGEVVAPFDLRSLDQSPSTISGNLNFNGYSEPPLTNAQTCS